MRNVAVDDAEVIVWEGDGFRLIPSRFPPVSVYEGLVAPARLEALVEVENLTNPRLVSERRLATLPMMVAQGAARLQNWNLAPFAYPNPEGSTFFDATRPCLELSCDRQTALAVSIAKRERFLQRTAEPPIGLDMRMLKTPLAGRFLDLRHLPPGSRDSVELEPDAEVDGILFRPAERSSATCIAVLKGAVLGRSVQAAHYRYVWDGLRVSSVYAFDALGRELLPEAIAGEKDILAA